MIDPACEAERPIEAYRRLTKVAGDVEGVNGAEDGTRTRYPQPHSVRTLRVSSGGLDLVRRAA